MQRYITQHSPSRLSEVLSGVNRRSHPPRL